MAKVTMPQLGESVAEGTIGKWLKQPGDSVEKYEPLLEVITDKVNAEVPSPFAGILTEILVEEGATVPNNAEIAVIETADEGRAAADSPAPTAEAAAPAPSPAPEPVPSPRVCARRRARAGSDRRRVGHWPGRLRRATGACCRVSRDRGADGHRDGWPRQRRRADDAGGPPAASRARPEPPPRSSEPAVAGGSPART